MRRAGHETRPAAVAIVMQHDGAVEGCGFCGYVGVYSDKLLSDPMDA